MTRVTMRNLLRRRLQDAGGINAQNWEDTDLNELLNLGLHKAQKAILKVSPLAFMAIDKQTIEEDQEFYAKPDGFWYERQIQLLDTSENRYRTIKREDYEIASRRESTSSEITWSDFGRHIAIFPVPSARVALGLRWLYVPTLEMSADNDVPQIHQGLHTLPLWYAHRLALGETGETNEAIRDVEGLIGADLADIPDYYHGGGSASGDMLVPQFHKGF